MCGECGNHDCTDPKHGKADKDFMFFGLVDGDCAELGYFSLSELQSIRGPAGLGIEWDMYWDPRPLSEVQKTARGQ